MKIALLYFTAGALLAQSTLAAQGGLREPVDNFDDDAPGIVGGSEAPRNRYSNWTVGLLSPDFKDGQQPFCGGSYIGKNIVLTAAHCVESGSGLTNIRVEGGRFDWTSTTEKGVKMTVNRIIINPSYSKKAPQDSDIAILRVSGGDDLSFYPELDDGSFSAETKRRTFKIIGWGQTSETSDVVPRLRQAIVDLTPEAECKRLYNDEEGRRITSTMICAKRPNIDTCQGDSGGPMFVDNAVPVLVGLTSWGDGCARAPPGVYSRISALRTFVDRTLGCSSGTTFTGGKCQ